MAGESSEARQRSRSPRRADSEDWLVLNLMEAALDILAGPGPGRIDGSRPPRPSQVALTAAVAEELEPRVEVEDDCAATATKEASQETTDTQGTATTLPDDVSKAWRELGRLVKEEGKVIIDAAEDMSDYMQSVCGSQAPVAGPKPRALRAARGHGGDDGGRLCGDARGGTRQRRQRIRGCFGHAARRTSRCAYGQRARMDAELR